jgi:hypothetical protein
MTGIKKIEVDIVNVKLIKFMKPHNNLKVTINTHL